VSEGGFEPPAPGYLPGRGTRPAMSPVLYRAEPLRQESDAPSRVLPGYAAGPSPASATAASSGGGVGSERGVVSGPGISSAIWPRTSERRISIFLIGWRVLTPCARAFERSPWIISRTNSG